MPQPKPLRLIQITDTHIHSEPGGKLGGVDVDQSLEKVLDHIRHHHWPADLILLTGDVGQDGGDRAYARVADALKPLGMPIYCLPGNHDYLPALARAPEPLVWRTDFEFGGWHFLMLDSTIPRSSGGRFSEATLAALDQALSEKPDLPTLIAMHHQPVRMGSDWLDTMMIQNAENLFEILDRHPQTKAAIWGHVHQDLSTQHGDIKLYSTPSTCMQFKPNSEDSYPDDANAGYRWFNLYPNGNFETGVERIDNG